MDPAILEARVGPKLTVYDGKTSKDVLINDPTSHCYIPQPRFDHCSFLIDDKLFVHRGRGCTFNKANLEEYDTVSEQWRVQTTSGDIPEPFSGMASARKGKMLYTFGGEIQAKMYTNVVSELDTSSLIWRMLHPTNPEHAPVPKRDAAMMSYKDYLVMFGGFSVSAGSSRNATYDKKGVNQVWTNEVTIFDVNRSQWIWEKISGHAPKPCGECTLTYIGQDKAILLGGLGKSGQVKNGPMNTVKLLELSNWSWISLRCKAQHINDFPKNCYGHCTISLHEVQDSETDPSVVLLWGRTGQMSYQDDMWQLTISSEGGIWRKIVFLEGTCTRCPPAYKFSAEIIQTPSSLQLIRFGGMTMGKRFPLEDTWIVDLAVNPSKIKEIGVVHCRIPRPDSVKPESSSTDDVDNESVDIAKKADNISDEVFLETAESSHKDDSEPHNTVSNAHATKESSPVTSPNSKEMSKDTCEHQTINADTQPLVKIEQYPGLNFFNQHEEREIKYSAEEQHLEMKDMGLSMTIPPEAIVPQENPVHLTVTPAVHGNIRIPEDCRPHSPMYMLSPLKLAKDAKVTVSHTCLIEDEEDSNNMVVLVPVNLAEAQASGVYTLKEIDVEKKFEKGSQEGEIKLRQLQPFRVAKRVSRRPDNKLYTARVYKKNHDFCTPDDVVIFSVTPRHASYIKVLEDVMKKSYPHLKLIEQYDSLRFKDDCNKVTLLFPKSGEIGKWDMHTMKDTITRDAIDPPDGYDITNLDCSPMIRLRVINNGPQPSKSRTKYSIRVHGFLEDFEIKLIFELLEIRDQRIPSCKDDIRKVLHDLKETSLHSVDIPKHFVPELRRIVQESEPETGKLAHDLLLRHLKHSPTQSGEGADAHNCQLPGLPGLWCNKSSSSYCAGDPSAL